MHEQRPSNTLAIVALVCALLGFLTCVTAPIGAILGHVARKQSRERYQANGTATAAIAVGWSATAVMSVVVIAWVAFTIWVLKQPTPVDSGGNDYDWDD